MESKSLKWVKSSKKDMLDFPREIVSSMGFALRKAQQGSRHEDTKILKGFEGAGVIEIIQKDDSGTYRLVYTIKMRDVVYVLHAFKKKSKHGIETPKRELDLIRDRLKEAFEMHKNRIF